MTTARLDDTTGPRLVQRGALLVCALIVLYPLGHLLVASFTVQGAPSLAAFRTVLADHDVLASFSNTIGVAVGSSLLALALAIPLAFLTVRTDLPLRKSIRLVAFVPLITPPFIGALAWALLGAPRTGMLNLAGRWLGLEGPWLNAYSLGGVIFVLGLSVSPYVFIMTSVVLERMDPALEEAALVTGSSTAHMVRRVLLPLATPGLAAGALLAFLESAEQFGVPAILGRPANVFVLPTEIFRLMNQTPSKAWFKKCHFQVTPETDRTLTVKGFLILGVTLI